MQSRNQRINSVQIENSIDNIIKNGLEINKQIIFEAETINYRNVPKELIPYDSFGFLDKYKDKKELNRYLKYFI
jgi:hypothetical protein